MPAKHHFSETLDDILSQGGLWIGYGYYKEGKRGDRLFRSLRQSFPEAFSQSISALQRRVESAVAAGRSLERGRPGTRSTLGGLPRVSYLPDDIAYRVNVRYRAPRTGEIRSRPVLISDLGLATREEIKQRAIELAASLIAKYRERGRSVSSIERLIVDATIEVAARR